MIDLFLKFAHCTSRVERQHFDSLELAGVPHDFLWRGAMRFGIANIIPSASGFFELADSPDAPLAIVAPAAPILASHEWTERDDIEDIVDLVAWRPEEPARWWVRLGSVPFMNPGAILGAEFYREPLKLWSSPLAWMQSGGEGTVILDPEANLRFWLGGVPEIIAETPELGRAIDRRLREPAAKLPRVMVPRSRAA